MGAFGVLSGIVALITLTFTLLLNQVSVLGENQTKSREVLLKSEKEDVESCRKKLLTYVYSQKLPYTFNLPVKEVCGNFYWVKKENCDSYYCDYAILFGKFEREAKPVFRITKKILSSFVEGENVKRLLEIAEALKNYQKSFPDHELTNHFLDVGDTSGYDTLSAYSDFFENLQVEYKDLYSRSLGTNSNFEICTSNGGDCSGVNSSSPYNCKLKYTSPYTGKTIEVEVIDN